MLRCGGAITVFNVLQVMAIVIVDELYIGSYVQYEEIWCVEPRHFTNLAAY